MESNEEGELRATSLLELQRRQDRTGVEDHRKDRIISCRDLPSRKVADTKASNKRWARGNESWHINANNT